MPPKGQPSAYHEMEGKLVLSSLFHFFFNTAPAAVKQWPTSWLSSKGGQRTNWSSKVLAPYWLLRSTCSSRASIPLSLSLTPEKFVLYVACKCFAYAWVNARDEDRFFPDAMAFVVNRRSSLSRAGAWGSYATFPRKFDNVCSTIWFWRKSCRRGRWFYQGEAWLSWRWYQGKTGVLLWGPILTHPHRLGSVLSGIHIIVPWCQEKSSKIPWGHYA